MQSLIKNMKAAVVITSTNLKGTCQGEGSLLNFENSRLYKNENNLLIKNNSDVWELISILRSETLFFQSPQDTGNYNYPWEVKKWSERNIKINKVYLPFNNLEVTGLHESKGVNPNGVYCFQTNWDNSRGLYIFGINEENKFSICFEPCRDEKSGTWIIKHNNDILFENKISNVLFPNEIYEQWEPVTGAGSPTIQIYTRPPLSSTKKAPTMVCGLCVCKL